MYIYNFTQPQMRTPIQPPTPIHTHRHTQTYTQKHARARATAQTATKTAHTHMHIHMIALFQSNLTTVPLGYFSNSTLDITCQPCSPGSYSSIPASSSCTPCPPTQIAPAASSQCTACILPFTANAMASSCSSCASGYSRKCTVSCQCTMCFPGVCSLIFIHVLIIMLRRLLRPCP